ncbi:hypothetical protein MtrunA17_Chr3g0086351 [Medicago truncatula]|uniref:Leguminosin group486 secreted peptide n=1 Tax=Medicago truncatula TaxID=3880 RepID=A0A072UVJ9_MEDTR|nr:leguminosin group486 secreted peptide [Medicago truncatula]RHN66030.1 hypothetical protein MtrunA17_Chr3g0086351 [Medicago truncatula]
MSISIHVSFFLLLLIAMCFNNLTFGSRVSIPLNSPISQAGKILMVTITNDLPRDSGELDFHIVNEKPKYLLKLGEPVGFVSNLAVKQGELRWTRYQPLHATFDLYDPKVDGDHTTVYWSVRLDGVHHSWDNVSWIETVFWST